MTSIILKKETGWQLIPGNTSVVVAHYEDGHIEQFDIIEFLTMEKDKIKSIDCYEEDEFQRED